MLSDPTLKSLLVKHAYVRFLKTIEGLRCFDGWGGWRAVTFVGLTTGVSQFLFECQRMTPWFLSLVLLLLIRLSGPSFSF